MALEIAVHDADGRERVISVQDPEHPRLVARFHYLVEGSVVALVGMAVLPNDERLQEGQWQVLTVSEIRQLPLVTWEQAARAAVTRAPAQRTTDLQRLAAIAHLVETVRPDLDPEDASPAAAREWERAWSLAETAVEYRGRLRAGSRSPVADIAEARGEPITTVRGRIHRARQAGYLGPASGRTAGEGTTT